MIEMADEKAHLNVTTTDDDTLLAAKIDAASAWIASFCGIDIEEDFPDGVPETLKEACRQLVAHLYENREATIVGVSMQHVSPGLYELMAHHRCWTF